MNAEKPLAFVIEDDINLAHAYSKAIADANYEVELILDGRQALKSLIARTPDIILLDLHIPFLSGEDILEYISEENRLVDSKVIIITADDRQGEMLRKSVDSVLIKPIGYQQLRNMASRYHPLSL